MGAILINVAAILYGVILINVGTILMGGDLTCIPITDKLGITSNS
jgi:hypothetical protein